MTASTLLPGDIVTTGTPPDRFALSSLADIARDTHQVPSLAPLHHSGA